MKNSQHNSPDLYLIAFCKGDNAAITSQYKCWLPELYLIAYRYTKNQEQSEDIVADCFEKLLQMPLEKRKQKFIEEEINLKALLIVIVKNKCLDYIKTTKNRLYVVLFTTSYNS